MYTAQYAASMHKAVGMHHTARPTQTTMWYQLLTLLPYVVAWYALLRPSSSPLAVVEWKRLATTAVGGVAYLRLGVDLAGTNGTTSLPILPDSRASPVQSLTTAPLPFPQGRRHLTRDEVIGLIHEAARYAACVLYVASHAR